MLVAVKILKPLEMKALLALGAELHLSQYGGWNQLQNQSAYQKIRVAKNKCLSLCKNCGIS